MWLKSALLVLVIIGSACVTMPYVPNTPSAQACVNACLRNQPPAAGAGCLGIGVAFTAQHNWLASCEATCPGAITQ